MIFVRSFFVYFCLSFFLFPISAFSQSLILNRPEIRLPDSIYERSGLPCLLILKGSYSSKVSEISEMVSFFGMSGSFLFESLSAGQDVSFLKEQGFSFVSFVPYKSTLSYSDQAYLSISLLEDSEVSPDFLMTEGYSSSEISLSKLPLDTVSFSYDSLSASRRVIPGDIVLYSYDRFTKNEFYNFLRFSVASGCHFVPYSHWRNSVLDYQ